MDNKKRKKRAYTTPEIKVYPMQEDCLLQAVSGQHKHIGQGGTFGSAKQWGEEWEETSSTPSEGGENTLPNYDAWGE
mgnify:CR=1 FL=1